jgi:adenine phosphoribosyltransferase
MTGPEPSSPVPAATASATPVPGNPAPLSAPISEIVATRLRDVPDFPVAGVIFKDFTPLLSDGPALRVVVQDISRRYAGQVDVIVGIEARGLILGAAVAYELGIGFVPVRKAGKLPGETHSAEYDLEYGTAVIEVHADAFKGGKRALVMDDVLATGGTAEAACDLVERAGASVEAVEFVLELGFLHGRSKLTGRPVHAILSL